MNGNLSPFERGYLPIKPREFLRQCLESGAALSRAEAKALLRKTLADEIHLNEEYQVNVDKNPPHGFGDMVVWHLSIKRRDRAPLHDWRDLQAIKNAIAGPQYEAIELYPAESRVVDTANQYHLFVFIREGEREAPRVPVGWTRGLRTTKPLGKSVQREFA